MSDQQLQPGYWRDASRLLNLYGIPAPLFLLYLAWFRFPSMVTIYVITAIIGGFRLLSFFGWTFKVLVMRLAYLMRGKRMSGRPWWYRRFTERGER
ncbi:MULTISPECIES: IcmT/TraK family protein [Pseudomonas syringae group]|uniref:DNA invertase n=7 Tax=Pseudomonas syringae group TaxID=136849 RepID=A0A0P9TQQ3_PSEA0|nr:MULTISPECIES: IcmT/TraK family protein [Pseudomonas syringae group]PPS24248.1 conjugal transfer protein [Pseudomonas amygdali pv. morsprunorum]KKY53930.1 conjugal transfer protein [Pseudomonas amygdali pv. lachrymans]KPB96712.1 TraK protein [Pseudomonas amygdali pv. lachrymans]KPC29719.1 TraK protein [Pseudomonas savastanoi pv. glycinea]KPC46658.1 TraK protein [Pseudomonas savastanoi pv. glycinea]